MGQSDVSDNVHTLGESQLQRDPASEPPSAHTRHSSPVAISHAGYVLLSVLI